MGYESRLHFVNKYGTQIADIDLCKMGYDFPHGNFYDLFNKEYEIGLYGFFGGIELTPEQQKEYGCEYIPDIKIYEDCYGKKLKYCDIKDLHEWCKLNRKQMRYRRVDLLYKITKELSKENKWGKVRAVFFGY